MHNAFVATRTESNALMTQDHFLFASGVQGVVTDYDSSVRDERDCFVSFIWTNPRDGRTCFAREQFTGRNARRNALDWLERMANA